jgi:4-hydroxy-tetrahydrodipicolinate synthase
VQLQGCITALATPFTDGHALDFSAWRMLLDAQLRGGVQGVVVAGSTGEAQMLSDEEFVALIRAAVQHISGKIPVLAGAGLSATDKTIRQCKLAAEAGVDAVLVVVPPYVRPTQEGLRRHYEAVADASPVPVVLYNVPSRTSCDMKPETVAALVPHPNIIGLKETVFDRARIDALVKLRSADFALCWGDDPTALQVLLDGADAVISVASNVVPAAFRALCDAGLARDEKTGRALDAELSSMWSALSLEPNPVPLKAMLAEFGIGADVLRLPLVPLSSPNRAALSAAASVAKSVEARFVKA